MEIASRCQSSKLYNREIAMIRSIPLKTSTGSSPQRRALSMDPVRFRTRGFSLNIGIGSPNRQESFKSVTKKKSKVIKYSPGLERLLTEAKRRLEEVMKELRTACSDDLLDKYSELSDFIHQLKWQVMVRKER